MSHRKKNRPDRRLRQLTVRGFDPQLEESLRSTARARGVSLNQAALLLLRRGAGIGEAPESVNVVGSSLDRFIGSWSPAEERAFLAAIESLEQLDESLWR